jgi:glucosamine kinase
MHSIDYVVGVDAGATSTRAIAVGMDGRVLGRGTEGGANPNSHPPDVAAARTARAMAAAIADLNPDRARACVLGLAGSSRLTDEAIAEVFRHQWQGLGLPCEIRVVADQEVAFASGTSQRDGAVLVAGTGSIASTIVDRRLVATIGGYGWLLGDEGSAYWIGREAVRATLRVIQSGMDRGPLALAVVAEALGASGWDESYAARRGMVSRLISAVSAEPPIRLARFAPLVSDTVGEDPVAKDIVAATVDVLAEMAETARTPGTPVVLTGSVVGPDAPVGIGLRDRLGQVSFAADGAAGAAWLAAVDLLGDRAPRPRVA